MRKIKFRAWDEESQKIYYVATLDTESVYGKCEVPIIRVKTGKMLDEYQPEYKTVYDYTLMQYTGLKDKNGIEIYEGDIVENTTQTVYLGDKFEVVWNKNYAGYQLMSNGFTSNIPLIQNFMSYKVIGNIYENPELMADRGRTSGGAWEMKLYAVVDKKSEVIATETVGPVSITLYGLKETAVRRRRESDMMETSDIVAVELKEVAGPCEWCEPKTIPLFYAECVRANIDDESQLISVNYCPNCGRRLRG